MNDKKLNILDLDLRFINSVNITTYSVFVDSKDCFLQTIRRSFGEAKSTRYREGRI